jgi:ABC-type nitrate/sulfonate/bicarbonate transport system substrate-binding protein
MITALASVVALASCSADGGESGGPDPDNPVHAAVQFGWTPNVENMASILAEQEGHFRDEGIDIDILPGGPEVAVDAQVVSGNADMGIVDIQTLATAVANGAPIVGIGATYQTSGSAVLTLEGSGISKPSDLEGKTFGLSQIDHRVYEPFLKAEGVDMSTVKIVDTGAEPASLVSGEVDAMSSMTPNQPVVLREQGKKPVELPLAKYGYNPWNGILAVRKDALADDSTRPVIMAMARAVESGLEDAVRDPAAAGHTVYTSYAKDLGLDEYSQVEGAKVWAGLTTAGDRGTDSTGLALVDDAGVRSQQDFLTRTGFEGDASDMFDLEASREAFGNVGANQGK